MIRRSRSIAFAGRRPALLMLMLLMPVDPALAQTLDGPPGAARVPNLNPLSTLDPAALGDFKGRPLFAPSRRPPPPREAVLAPPVPIAVEAPPPDLRLVGVVAGADKAVAILRRPAGGPSLSLKVGDTVEAWRVDAIGPDRVSLREGEREKTYRLFSVGGGPPSQQPASRITNLPLLSIPGPQ